MSRVPTAARPQRYSSERIGKLKAVPQRTKAQKDAGPFSDLTWLQQQAAQAWYWKFCARWGSDLPQWRRGILIGVARRLALNPPPAGWAKWLHGHVGGRIRARQLHGRSPRYPLHILTRA